MVTRTPACHGRARRRCRGGLVGDGIGAGRGRRRMTMRLGAVFPQAEFGPSIRTRSCASCSGSRTPATTTCSCTTTCSAPTRAPAPMGRLLRPSRPVPRTARAVRLPARACSLELVTDVLVLPQRQTALVAKQVATLALLAPGPHPARRRHRVERRSSTRRSASTSGPGRAAWTSRSRCCGGCGPSRASITPARPTPSTRPGSCRCHPLRCRSGSGAAPTRARWRGSGDSPTAGSRCPSSSPGAGFEAGVARGARRGGRARAATPTRSGSKGSVWAPPARCTGSRPGGPLARRRRRRRRHQPAAGRRPVARRHTSTCCCAPPTLCARPRKIRQVPGTPLSSCSPRSGKVERRTRQSSLTVLDTTISPAPPCAATRAPMCTASPPICSPRTSTSPVCTPARIATPIAGERVADRPGAADGAARPVEGREEPVARRVDLVAAEPCELAAHDRVVLIEQRPATGCHPARRRSRWSRRCR